MKSKFLAALGAAMLITISAASAYAAGEKVVMKVKGGTR